MNLIFLFVLFATHLSSLQAAQPSTLISDDQLDLLSLTSVKKTTLMHVLQPSSITAAPIFCLLIDWVKINRFRSGTQCKDSSTREVGENPITICNSFANYDVLQSEEVPPQYISYDQEKSKYWKLEAELDAEANKKSGASSSSDPTCSGEKGPSSATPSCSGRIQFYRFRVIRMLQNTVDREHISEPIRLNINDEEPNQAVTININRSPLPHKPYIQLTLKRVFFPENRNSQYPSGYTVIAKSLVRANPFFSSQFQPYFRLNDPLITEAKFNNVAGSEGNPFVFGKCRSKRQFYRLMKKYHPRQSIIRDAYMNELLKKEFGSIDERFVDIKHKLYGQDFHSCGEDEYLHATYTKENHSTDVILAVADGVGGSQSANRDPGLLSLLLMQFLKRFIAVYPGWSPLDYVNVLVLCFRDFASSITKLGRLYSFLFNLNPFSDTPDMKERMMKYRQHVKHGASTLSIFKYNINTGLFSYANIGDSGFVVLRLNRPDGFYSVVFKTNTGQFSFNSPFNVNFNQESSRYIYLTSMHNDGNVIGPRRFGVFPDCPSHYRSKQYQANVIKGKYGNPVKVNTLPEIKRPVMPTSQLEPGDIVIGGTDGLLDNLHDMELEAIVTSTVKTMNGRARHEIQEEISKALDELLSKQVVGGPIFKTSFFDQADLRSRREVHLKALLESVSFVQGDYFKGLTDKVVIPFIAALQPESRDEYEGGSLSYAKTDDVTFMVSVVPPRPSGSV